jgi:broad specificity phosphatase PhoE
MQVARVVAGGLVRQRDTIAPFAAEHGLEVVEDVRWDEYDTDDILSAHSTTPIRHERRSGSDAPAVSSRAFQDVLEDGLLGWIAAGDQGPAQETWPAFAARVDGALRTAVTGLGRGETAVVCTSGGVLAAVLVALLAVDPATFVRFNRVAANAGISKVVAGRTGLTLLSYNEHGHLELAADPAPLLTYR